MAGAQPGGSAGATDGGRAPGATPPYRPYTPASAQPRPSPGAPPAGRAGTTEAARASSGAGSTPPLAPGGTQANSSSAAGSRPSGDASNRRSTAQNGGPVYKPGPDVRTTALPGGAMMHVNPGSRSSVSTDAGGRILTFEKPGLKANMFASDGRAARIERTGGDGSRTVVQRGFHDARTVEGVRPGGVRVVNQGQYGYVERPLRQDYVARTYVGGGRAEASVYHKNVYRNFPVWGYVPVVIYAPAFYGWAIGPWAGPVAYAWSPAPWGRMWGAYYAPEVVYATPSLWLTDYVIANNLNVAYETQLASGAPITYVEPARMGAPLSPQVKGMLAEQVRQQLEVDQMAAAQPVAWTPPGANAVPAALDPANRFFVVAVSVDVVSTAGGPTCTLTPGDVIQRVSDGVTNDGKIDIVVVSSKSAECPTSLKAAVDLATLQDMHNRLREQVASGLDKLASSSGSAGIPAAPAANPRPVPEGQAPVDSQAKNLLLAQAREADQVEEELKLAMDSSI